MGGEQEYPEEEAAADERAEADIRAGRVVSHEAVCRWLDSWGSAKPLRPPKRGE